MTRAASETDFDYKDIDTMETALLVGAERIKYLPEPFENIVETMFVNLNVVDILS